jgi:O-antigen ligase
MSPGTVLRAGGTLVITSFGLFYVKKHSRYRYLLIGVLALFFLLLTRSRAGIAATILAVFIYWILRKPITQKVAIVNFIICGIIFLFLSLSDSLWQNVFNLTLLGKSRVDFVSLTGRIPLWEVCISYIFDRPFLGYGFNSFWTGKHVLAVTNEANWPVGVPSAHNAYLEIALGLGIFGLIIYVFILLISIKKCYALFKTYHNEGYAFSFALLVWYSFITILQSKGFSPGIPVFILFTIIAKLAFYLPEITKTQLKHE